MKSSSFRPAVEELESRRLLAGNVTASVFKGQLILTGDAQANDLQISSPVAAVIQVVGQAGTTVNGGAAPVQFRGARDIVARLKGGDDLFSVSGIQLPGSLVYKAGPGNNSLGAALSFVGRKLKYVGGPENDTAVLTSMTIGGNLKFAFGAGSTMHVASFSNVRVLGNFAYTSEGTVTDILSGQGAIVHGKTSLKTGGGNDSLLYTNSIFLDQVFIRTGGGNDGVQFETGGLFGQTTFGSRLDLNTGGGDDSVTLGQVLPFPGQVFFRTSAILNGGAGTNNLSDVNTVKDDPAKFSAVNFT